MGRNQEVLFYSLVSQTHIKKETSIESAFLQRQLCINSKIINFLIPFLNTTKQIHNFIKGELYSVRPLNTFF